MPSTASLPRACCCRAIACWLIVSHSMWQHTRHTRRSQPHAQHPALMGHRQGHACTRPHLTYAVCCSHVHQLSSPPHGRSLHAAQQPTTPFVSIHPGHTACLQSSCMPASATRNACHFSALMPLLCPRKTIRWLQGWMGCRDGVYRRVCRIRAPCIAAYIPQAAASTLHRPLPAPCTDLHIRARSLQEPASIRATHTHIAVVTATAHRLAT
jgi:hypothetical protein